MRAWRGSFRPLVVFFWSGPSDRPAGSVHQVSFIDGHARANRQKPSGIAGEETVGRRHLLPMWGDRRLDHISTEDVQRLKARLSDRAPKTVNNILTVLNTLLRKAVEWGVLTQMPCTIRL